MTNLRARAFAPALVVQLFIALTISQHAFSQEAQTATQTAQTPPVAAIATAEKATAKEEACEQSPATTALTSTARLEQSGAGEATVPASQSLTFSSARTLKTNPARAFTFETEAPHASKSIDASGLFAQDPAGGAQQTSASVYTPLTSDEKMRRAFRSAFLSPQAYGISLASAIITEIGEDVSGL